MNKVLNWLEPVILLGVPAVLVWCTVMETEYTAVLTLFTAVLSIIPFFLRFEWKKPRAREMMPPVILAAVAAAGRVLFAAFPSVKPVTAIVIIGGCCFGRQSGFLTGALAALASNLFFGQGPWTPWQMYSWGVTGYLAGLLSSRGLLERPWQVLGFGFCAALLYGWIMDTWYIAGFVSPFTWTGALAAYGAGLPFSLIHGLATTGFLALTAGPWKKKIRRIQRKYGI